MLLTFGDSRTFLFPGQRRSNLNNYCIFFIKIKNNKCWSKVEKRFVETFGFTPPSLSDTRCVCAADIQCACPRYQKSDKCRKTQFFRPSKHVCSPLATETISSTRKEAAHSYHTHQYIMCVKCAVFHYTAWCILLPLCRKVWNNIL